MLDFSWIYIFLLHKSLYWNCALNIYLFLFFLVGNHSTFLLFGVILNNTWLLGFAVQSRNKTFSYSSANAVRTETGPWQTHVIHIHAFSTPSLLGVSNFLPSSNQPLSTYVYHKKITTFNNQHTPSLFLIMGILWAFAPASVRCFFMHVIRYQSLYGFASP